MTPMISQYKHVGACKEKEGRHSQNCSGNCSRNKRESLRSRYSLFPFLVPVSICSQLLKKVSFSVQKIGACGGLTCSRSTFIGNSYLAAGGVAFRSVPHMGHFCAVPPGRMLFAIFEFVKGSFVVSFNSSYVSLLCGSYINCLFVIHTGRDNLREHP